MKMVLAHNVSVLFDNGKLSSTRFCSIIRYLCLALIDTFWSSLASGDQYQCKQIAPYAFALHILCISLRFSRATCMSVPCACACIAIEVFSYHSKYLIELHAQNCGNNAVFC